MAVDLALDTGPTIYQTIIALAIVVLAAVGLIVARYYREFLELSDEQKRQKKALLGQLEANPTRTMRHSAAEAIRNRRGELLATIRGGEDDTMPDQPRVSRALAEAWHDLRTTWYGVLDRYPPLAIRFAEVAGLLLLLGSIATVSVDTWSAVFSAGGGSISTGEVVRLLEQTVSEGANWGVDLVGSFPFSGIIYGLTLAYAIETGRLLWQHPLVLAGLLIATGAVVIALDRRYPEARSVQMVESRRNVVTLLLAVFVAVWLSGVVPTAVIGLLGSVSIGGYTIDFQAIGAVVGLVAALAQLVILGRAGLRDIRSRIGAMRREIDDTDGYGVAYIVARRFGAVVAGLSIPLLPTYAVYIAAEGRLGAVSSAFLDGSPAVQLLIGVAIIGVVALLLYRVREAWPELRAALQEIFSRRAIRALLFVRGPPVGVFVVGYFVAVEFAGSAIPAVIAALVLSLVTRQAMTLARRTRYHLAATPERGMTTSNVLIRATTLETADGDSKYHVAVNDVTMAHDDPETLVDEVVEVVEQLLEDGEAAPRVSRKHAEDVLEYGTVDYQETEKKVLRETILEVKGRLRRQNPPAIDKETLEEKLENRVPRDVWEEYLYQKRRSGRIMLNDGQYILFR